MAKNAIEQGLKRSGKNYAVFARIFLSLEESTNEVNKFVDYNYNLDFDSRSIVGDNYNDVNERKYGCNRVMGPKAEHGTHVAGIIAASRYNGTGIDGVADNVKIMVLRVVPDGDERDKDVANAIRYAVDNGAKIINMSFGKSFSSNKNVVDEAIKYALSKDVLLIHAAGNDAKNTDIEDNFPKVDIEKGVNASNWIEVGASSWKLKKYLTADFSNYGKNRVDVFAPGVDINSCIPESKYAVYSGTSMAAPVTAGVAALLKSYYPQLTAPQIKDIILKSSIKYKKKVLIPGKNKKVKLSELCKTGGIVNAYSAVFMAEQMFK
jgi:subtilisin family serine protease